MILLNVRYVNMYNLESKHLNVRKYFTVHLAQFQVQIYQTEHKILRIALHCIADKSKTSESNEITHHAVSLSQLCMSVK